ncbi:PREDICTED: wiskott-Aldrich syndrome protein family member 2-like [Branchiostoma belcheri]|uniref:Wiskott-Aldrich syndrome protein family member 2-like n=1 Tax=Branchiostoma belcheri TaxID=7741 RepID=A0A6P4YCT4_BRABE|nr:PREDICTED: wiskott-Aldrich syndrome protein family member 2-like [Branchiostoma belcheri]
MAPKVDFAFGFGTFDPLLLPPPLIPLPQDKGLPPPPSASLAPTPAPVPPASDALLDDHPPQGLAPPLIPLPPPLTPPAALAADPDYDPRNDGPRRPVRHNRTRRLALFISERPVMSEEESSQGSLSTSVSGPDEASDEAGDERPMLRQPANLDAVGDERPMLRQPINLDAVGDERPMLRQPANLDAVYPDTDGSSAHLSSPDPDDVARSCAADVLSPTPRATRDASDTPRSRPHHPPWKRRRPAQY